MGRDAIIRTGLVGEKDDVPMDSTLFSLRDNVVTSPQPSIATSKYTPLNFSFLVYTNLKIRII